MEKRAGGGICADASCSYHIISPSHFFYLLAGKLDLALRYECRSHVHVHVVLRYLASGAGLDPTIGLLACVCAWVVLCFLIMSCHLGDHFLSHHFIFDC